MLEIINYNPLMGYSFFIVIDLFNELYCTKKTMNFLFKVKIKLLYICTVNENKF